MSNMQSKVTRLPKNENLDWTPWKKSATINRFTKNSYYKVHVWNRDKLLITIVNIFEELNKRENFSQNVNCNKYENEINKKQKLQLKYELTDLTEESKHR